MPTPIGHALGGLIVGLALRPADKSTGAFFRRRIGGLSPFLWACLVVACLPDLDFLWGRHNMETHSVGFAAVVGVAAFAWRSRRAARPSTRPSGPTAWPDAARVGVACALAVTSHVAFDWLGSDDSPPLGVMALWPFNDTFYFADAFVFEAISRRYWLPGFLRHNLLAALREIGLLAPAAAILWRWRGRGQGPSGPRPRARH